MAEDLALTALHIPEEFGGAGFGVAELGIAGPSGSAYGIDAGTSVIAVSGPTDAAITINTGQSDRAQNMEAFTDSACQLLCDVLQASSE